MQSNQGGIVMSKQHLYIILDDCELGFSIRKVDLDLDQWIPLGCKARDVAASLPPASIRFRQGRSEMPVCFSDALGSKILAMQPKEKRNIPDRGGFCFDVQERSLNFIPCHTRQLRPVYFPIGDKLFVLGCFSMELLDLDPLVVSSPSGDSLLSWRKLPAAPFDSLNVISHAIVLDKKTILVSLDINPTMTYLFHIEDFKWECLGDWIMPFDGCGCFILELDTWVGMALYREKHGRICSCNLSSVATSEHRRPEVKYGKEYLFTEDSAEMHRGSKLIYTGDGNHNRFCLVECVKLIGNKDDNTGQDENMVVDPPPRRVHMFRLTKFSLKLDENGDLTTGDSRRVRYYKVSDKGINDLLFLWPLVFWL